MVRDGFYYGAAFVAAGFLVGWLSGLAFAIPLWLLAVFCLNFFRDPERSIPAGPVAVSPADGKVTAVASETPSLQRVSIFLNIFDVHVNRSPIAGCVTGVDYRQGHFFSATRADSSDANEQNVVTVEGQGSTVVFKQIAGLIARRIVFSKKPGEAVAAGERVGLIKFGSRCDVLLGPEWEIVVQPGQRVVAGSSVIARRIDQGQPHGA